MEHKYGDINLYIKRSFQFCLCSFLATGSKDNSIKKFGFNENQKVKNKTKSIDSINFKISTKENKSIL